MPVHKKSFKLVQLMVAIAAAFSTSSASASDDIPRGKLIERLACAADQSQSYALYLPSTYDPHKTFPIIYAFDPGARGARPVDRFKDACEKLGFIIVGSNNSRNGPWAPTLTAFQAMWQDTHARLSIDDKRVYMAGLSGGARVACRLGFGLKGQVAGVIACSAGLPVGIDPTPTMPFALFATAGTEDFNYSELRRLHRVLNELKALNRFDVFEGGHEWAPSSTCIAALEWMELQAMKSGAKEKNEGFIESILKTDIEKARSLETSGQLYGAWAAYIQIAIDFRGLRDVTEFEKQAGQLKDSKEVSRGLKRDEQLDAEERKRGAEMQGLLEAIYARPAASTPVGSATGGAADDGSSPSRALTDLKRALADLKKKSEATEKTEERALARRLLNGFLVGESEASAGLIQEKKYAAAVERLRIDAQLTPDRPRVFFSLACAYALSGNKKRALEALNTAVDKGFIGLEELQRNPALDSLREDAAFKKIVEDVRLKTKQTS
jgi:poly(3-hydroxybutyrate) depolymerase